MKSLLVTVMKVRKLPRDPKTTQQGATTTKTRTKMIPSFRHFKQLPLELRLQIWHEARTSYVQDEASANTPAIHLCPVFAQGSPGRWIVPSATPPPLVTPLGSANLKLACREANEACSARSATALSRLFDPAIDTLIATDYRQLQSVVESVDLPAWLRDIRHLAIPLTACGYSEYVIMEKTGKALAHLPRLERISYILPDRNKTVDVNESPGQKVLSILQGPKIDDGVGEAESPGFRVHVLREAESQAVRVQCDYWDDPGGACPPSSYQWDVSLDDYLNNVRKYMLQQFSRETGLGHIWNENKKHPQLRIELGACYVGSVHVEMDGA
jgi:hypothetical protein